ncbi:MAG TPA: acetyl-CoA carboxylase biotin carboxyl carrier protein subunit [Candidatus Atribacteria bacterium]|nr:acetyl-CoA carboxylase biotin carboxyl carrier protein subunit [Candidatus Atribacteria bacterium]
MKKYKINVNGQSYEVEVEEISGEITPIVSAPAPKASVPKAPAPKAAAPKAPVESTGGEEINAPMPGKILQLKVKEGDSVSEGDTLLILEAMKMENEIFANTSGKIKNINVSVNDMVDTGDVLIIIG